MTTRTIHLCAGLCLVLALAAPAAGQPKNIIFCIGDGMGPEQVEAARLFAGAPMSFENFTFHGSVTTYSVNSSVTDSAAAATALATGVKVNNGVISLAIPGDSSELPTLLEYYQARDRATGLVTTTYMTHATPAGFGAHESSRNNNSQIANDYLTQTRPNVLLGGGANGMSVAAAQSAGYTVVTDAAGLARTGYERRDLRVRPVRQLPPALRIRWRRRCAPVRHDDDRAGHAG